ncbi:MAG: hypothetical protein HY202_06905 [Nitrospirae bacterium]|nr:hypothetical protein [Nitrospirota bacterium]
MLAKIPVSENFPSHSDCGGRLAISAGMVHCVNCGHLPLNTHPEIDSDDLTFWLPCLEEAGIIAKTDFQGMPHIQI